MSQSLSPFSFDPILSEPTGFSPQALDLGFGNHAHDPYIPTTGKSSNNDPNVDDARAADPCSALSPIEFPFEEFIDTDNCYDNDAAQDCLGDSIVKEQQFSHIATEISRHLPTPSETPPTPSHDAVAAEASLRNASRDNLSDCDVANDSESTPESASTSHSHPLRRLDNVIEKLKQIRTSLMGVQKRQRSDSFKEHDLSVYSAQQVIKRQLTGSAGRVWHQSDDGSSLRSWKTDECPAPEWSTQLSAWIGTLGKKPPQSAAQCAFTTPCLPFMERFKVHHIASSHGLHHMSAGKDRDSKFVVLSPFKLVPQLPLWDPPIEPFIDLSTLWVRGDGVDLEPSWVCDALRKMLYSDLRNGAPKPLNTRGVKILQKRPLLYPWKLEYYRGVCCRYQSQDEAAVVRSRIAAAPAVERQFRYGGLGLVKLRAEYAVQVGLYDDLPVAVSCNYATTREVFRDALSNPECSDWILDQCLRDLEPRTSAFRTASLRHDSQSVHSAESRYSDASRGSMASNMSQLSFASNRTRSERIENGYECVDCRKMFHRQCDRDKHWKNTHGQRAHVCTICEKGFVYEKDLTRHSRSMHG